MDLSPIPIYDHHAHALFHEHLWRSEPIEQFFTEAYDSGILGHFARDNLFFRRSIRDLAGFYGCEPSVEAVLEARQKWDYLELCNQMFDAANISHWLIDDGIWPDKLWTVAESGLNLPPIVRRVLRLESELAKLVETHDSATGLLNAFETQLRQEAPRIAGFKSIVAYRTGLDITRHNLVEIERAYTELRRSMTRGQPPRIASKPLLDAMLWMALKVARETDKPVQFHTGYGDPDLDMRLASPLHLRAVFEAPELKGVKVVLLHCYPYVREAGYLASVYAGAYLDLGLTIPYASVSAMRTVMFEALHLSPVSKVLFSTDAQRTPELFWLGAKWGRKVIGDVLGQTVQDSDLSQEEAYWAAERILYANASDLYGAFAN